MERVTEPHPASASELRSLWGLAITLGALTLAVSYTVQRLASWAAGEPALGDVVRMGSTPLYWRTAIAGWHAVLVASLVGLGVPAATAERIWKSHPAWIGLLVLGCAVALLWVP